MENIAPVEVKTISIETIKPISKTPSHLQTYELSLIDQIHPSYHTNMLLFYPNTVDTPPYGPNISVLKTALSKTLSTFYPFARRCKDEFTVTCNDQGIPFIETRVDCILSDFLKSPNRINHLHKLTPPLEFKAAKPLPKQVPLIFQVNVFSCGGVVLGCYKFHKLLLDGTSLVAFLKHWAALATNAADRDNNIIPAEPDFNAVLSAFPPRPKMRWQPFDGNSVERQATVQQYKDVHVVAKSFVFNKHAINSLRKMAASDEVPRPTRVETLAAFVWEHCMAAAYAAGSMPEGPEPTVMSMLVNMRARLNPPLPSTTMGNLVTTVSARANLGIGLPELVMNLHAAVAKISDRIELYEGGQNVEALVGDVAAFTAYMPGTYGLSSWCQFRLDEVDFGFGKPKWVSPTNGILSPTSSRNFIYFSVDSNGDGIEVWLYLEENEMQILESNNQFLAYASPN